jgi:uncharacterized protein involved in response to NO
MTITAEERDRRLRIPSVLSNAFRPLFLAAASWAIVFITLWFAVLLGHMQLPTRFSPLA